MNIKLNKNPFFDFFIICIDIFMCVTSYLGARVFVSLFTDVGDMGMADIGEMLLVIICIVFMLYVYEFYTKFVRRKYEIVLSVFLAVIVSASVTAVVNFIILGLAGDSVQLLAVMAPLILFILLSFEKLTLLSIMKKTEGGAKLLVIESKYVDSDLAKKIKYSYLELYEAWYVQIDINDEDEIQRMLDNEFINYDSIFISPSIPEKLRNRLVSLAVTLKKEIYILPDLYSISVMRNETVQFDDTPALRLSAFGPTNFQSTLKRGMDILFSFFCIVLTSPIMLICAIAIKLDSKGPVIYKQQRVTLDMKNFSVYKFRTMIQDAEKETGPTLATESDKRITRVGKLLRSTRLDELPQFFNILFGHMSVVGPRPERPVFVKEYCDEIENYDKRFFVKAGLTGLAQVYSRYDTNARDKTLYDLLYIKDYSLWLDIKLILLTIKIMFVKESSDGVKETSDYSNKMVKQ